MTNYRSGVRIEHKAVHWLKDAGYEVLRSAGSKGAFDIIAWDARRFRLIQIKKQSKPTTYKTDLDRIEQTVVPRGASKELWVYQSHKGWIDCICVGPVVRLSFPDGAKVRANK